MSAHQIMAVPVPEQHVCYVHCNFCNTVLAVNVPNNNFLTIVTVRCGHCSNLLSVNLKASVHSNLIQEQHQHQVYNNGLLPLSEYGSSSSKRTATAYSTQIDTEQMLPIRPAEKRQRVPSAYNRFIKDEIRRIKANNPEIGHREAFSTAAKNWAHFPHIHFGLTLDHHGSNSKQSKKQLQVEEAIKPRGFF